MLKIKVIATGVENLTDARYFAAMGVEAVCFDLSAISPESYYAIKEWIEGVQVYVKYTSESMDADAVIIDQLETYQADGSMILESSYDSIRESSLPAGQIINEHQAWQEYDQGKQAEIISYAATQSHYLHIPWTKELLEAAVAADEIHGIVVSGGAEEKIGYKSFLELDELFDIVEEEM